MEESRVANQYARDLAARVQAACDRDRKCPEAPPGFRDAGSSRRVQFVAGRRIDYKLLPDRTEFRITVHHVLEWLQDFEGGVGKTVVEREVIR